MSFIKNLLGGAAIMAAATLVGVAQNSVRHHPMTLFPRVSRPVATPVPNPGTIEERSQPTEEDTGANAARASAGDLGAEELAAGELSRERVKAIVGAGGAVILDARDEAEYAAGHIPGALNIPYERFIEYYDKLVDYVPMDATVIVYCRSVTCDLSDNLAQELRLMGYERVLLYRGGWDEWTEAGFPSETGGPSE